MQKFLIQQAQKEVETLRAKRDKTYQSMLVKRSALLKILQDDQPDLFGERISDRSEKLFDLRPDASQLTAALEPYRRQIEKIERLIDVWENKLINLTNIKNIDLFNLTQTSL